MVKKNEDSVRVVLIFGGLGFIGHRLAHSLSSEYLVHVIDNALVNRESTTPIALHELKRRESLLRNSGVLIHHLDILDEIKIQELLDGHHLDTAIHMAGASSVKAAYQQEGYDALLGITQKILCHLNKHQPKKLIYFSSSMVYGDFKTENVTESHSKQPVDFYGTYKYASEVLVNGWATEKKLISIVLRPTAVYGPNDIHERVVSKFIKNAKLNNKVMIVGDGNNKLDFTYVDDVVNAAEKAVQHNQTDTFNVSFGQARTLNELFSLIKILYPEAEAAYNAESKQPMANRGKLCSDKIISTLSFEPRFPLEMGLKKLLQEEGANSSFSRLPEPSFHIPLSKTDLTTCDFENIKDTLQSGWLTTGEQNTLFEQKLLDYLSPKRSSYALTVNSCASALILAIKSLSITGEVIVPAFTFSATANAVELAGAIPRFVDIETYTLGLDSKKIKDAISAKTQAILVVHLAGVVCDIEPIISVAEEHNLLIIEDCAQALGAELNGVKAGTFGDISCFSFFPTKTITTGEGGMLVTNNHEYYQTAKALSSHGYYSSTLEREKNEKPWHRQQVSMGYNFRMPNINAALGVSQINRIEKIISQRFSKASYLIKEIQNLPFIKIFEYHDRTSTYQTLNIIIDHKINRDEFVLKLRQRGVMASVHYPETLPSIKIFNKFIKRGESFPVATKIAQQIVTLPIFSTLTRLQLDHIIEVINIVANATTKENNQTVFPS